MHVDCVYCTFHMRIVMSYWFVPNDEIGEIAAPIAILLFVCMNPAHSRL